MADRITAEAAIQRDLEAYQAERETLVTKRAEIDEQIAGLDRRIKAARAYHDILEGRLDPDQLKPVQSRPRATGVRRTGIRAEILSLIKGTPEGLTAAEVREQLGVEAGDTSGSNSVSNALAALKGSDKLTKNSDGKYVAA